MTSGAAATPAPLGEPHLVDTTVWAKAANDPGLAAWFNDAARADLVLTCDMVALELLRSARDRRSYLRQVRQLALLRSTPMDAGVHARAREIQAALVGRGHHRGVPPADLLIAASAQAAAVPLLHYDADYDLIVNVTGQAATWMAAHGSIP